MRNVKVEAKGSLLTIIVDLADTGTLSKSGKSITIGTTEGNASIPTSIGPVSVGVNVYRKAS